MARAQGFARGDLDAAFPLDDKFLALRGRVSVERYYEATGIYFHVAAATWREAERKAASKVCPDAGDVLTDLIAVGLLDADGCVPRRAYMNTVGRAKTQRRTSTDRQARNRALSRVTPRDIRISSKSGTSVQARTESDGRPLDRVQKSRVTPRDSGVTPRESLARAPAPIGSSSREILTTENDTGRKGGVGGNHAPSPRQIVHHWLTEHGASTPVGWVNTTLNELVKVYGSDPILTLWSSAPSDVRTSKQFVQLAERSLAPGPNGKPAGGHTRTADEVNDAFH